MKKGFTLIELLIVVAIIAILAAIAVPNFLEAQTRSKVSRTVSDLRTLATGIEAYIVDNNKPPIDGHKVDGHAFWYLADGPRAPLNIGGVTSPIAYITSSKFVDPFRTQVEAETARQSDGTADAAVLTNFTAEDYKRFRYRNFKYTYGTNASFGENAAGAANVNAFAEVYGTWELWGSGPDRANSSNSASPTTINGVTRNDLQIIYDATNGTVSIGDIVRSQKYSAQPARFPPGV